MTLPPDIHSVGFSIDEDRTGEAYDNTKLSAVNVCPTWGILRYGMHRRMPTNYQGDTRSMALEIGKVAHDCFAAARLCTLHWHGFPEHAQHHGVRLFGADRWQALQAVIGSADTIDSAIRHVALETLATSGFYDSPFDRRRTYANLESAITAYAANYDAERWKVWVAEVSNPKGEVGIELPYSIRANFLKRDGSDIELRLTGKIDGIHWHREVGGEVVVHDNKTAGRIDQAWANSFEMSHQMTGYTVAARLITGANINRVLVSGMQIPLPKMMLDGLRDVWTVRDEHHMEQWVSWLWHTYNVYQHYKNDPIGAPKYTHSCNRYFRSCPFIPFCYGDRPEKEQILTEMVKDEWNPLSEEYDG